MEISALLTWFYNRNVQFDCIQIPRTINGVSVRPYPFFIHPSMQALRRKMTVAELGQLSPLSLKSPPCLFQPANGYSSIFASADKHTNKQIHRQHQRHRVSYLLSEAFDWFTFPEAFQQRTKSIKICLTFNEMAKAKQNKPQIGSVVCTAHGLPSLPIDGIQGARSE